MKIQRISCLIPRNELTDIRRVVVVSFERNTTGARARARGGSFGVCYISSLISLRVSSFIRPREVSTPLALPTLEHHPPIWHHSTANERNTYVAYVPYVLRRDVYISAHKPNASLPGSHRLSRQLLQRDEIMLEQQQQAAAAAARVRFAIAARAYRCSSLLRASRHFSSSVAYNPLHDQRRNILPELLFDSLYGFVPLLAPFPLS